MKSSKKYLDEMRCIKVIESAGMVEINLWILK